jgi:cytochrome c-type biogenesis protein
VAGFATVFVAMGASASFVGSFITRYIDTLSIVAGVIIIILGLHFLGVFRIGFLYRDFRLEGPKKSVGLPGPMWSGWPLRSAGRRALDRCWPPSCFSPGQEANVLRGALLLLAYALGIGIPFVLAAIFFRPFMGGMKRFRKHLGLVEKVTGGLLIVTGILFITGAMSWLAFYMLELFPGLGTIG